MRTIRVHPLMRSSYGRVAGIVDVVRWSTRPARIALNISVGIGLCSSVVVRPKTSVGVRLSVAVGLDVSRGGHRSHSDIGASLSPLGFDLANLRNSQRPTAIGLNGLLLPGEGRWRRRRSMSRHNDAIFDDDGWSGSNDNSSAEHSFSGGGDCGSCKPNASVSHFPLIDDH